MASCYADPALAERELGWKAAFGLDKMCKGIIPSLAQRALPAPWPPSPPCSLFQVRTCGGGSCRTPQASARTELWPRAGQAHSCSEPALPPSLRAVTILGEQFQLPLLSLARGRKAGASSVSPLLILIPQVFASHRAEPQQRTEPGPGLAPQAWEPLMGMPRGCSQPRLGVDALGLSLCPGHPALGHLSPAEPKVQHSPGSFPGSRAQGEPKAPLPWHREGTRNLPQGPVTFQGHHGSFPQPRASSIPLFPAPSMVLGTKSHLPPLLLSQRSPCPGLCQPGCPQPPWVPALSSCGSHSPNPVAKDCPGAALPPCPTLLLFIPGSSQGSARQG